MASRSRPSAPTAACRSGRRRLAPFSSRRVSVSTCWCDPPASRAARWCSARCCTTVATAACNIATSRTCSRIEFSKDPPLPKQPLPTIARAIVPPSKDGATRVPVILTLPPAGQDGKSEFRVNGVPYWQAKPFLAKLGETQLWTIHNDTEWDHPFHLHGFFFLPLDEKDEPIRPLSWKDTLNIPMKSHARFLVVFDERPGEWMFHCHILDHAEGGLMGTVLARQHRADGARARQAIGRLSRVTGVETNDDTPPGARRARRGLAPDRRSGWRRSDPRCGHTGPAAGCAPGVADGRLVAGALGVVALLRATADRRRCSLLVPRQPSAARGSRPPPACPDHRGCAVRRDGGAA